MADVRQRIVEIARLIYERHLSNSAGGNISVREGEHIYITPRYMGSRYQYRISPEQISVLDPDHLVLEGPRELSRESRLHLAIYDNLASVNSVIHAHPRFLMVFASAGRPMKPVTEWTQKFGLVECTKAASAHSQELADGVLEIATRRREQLEHAALGIILPGHGVAILGRDLDDAYDALERLEDNALIAINTPFLPKA